MELIDDPTPERRVSQYTLLRILYLYVLYVIWSYVKLKVRPSVNSHEIEFRFTVTAQNCL